MLVCGPVWSPSTWRRSTALDLPAPDSRADLYRDFVPVERARWFVVVDGRGRVRWTYTEMGGWHLLVLVAGATPPGYLAYLREEGIPYLVAGEARVDLADALGRLAERHGVRTVVADGGGRLNGALLRAGLVDEVDVQFLPAIIGSPDAPSLFAGFGLGDDDAPVRLTPIALEDQGQGFSFVRYTVAGDR
jgi:riboflavin biosynthesis pyrimidine reductase